MTRYGIEVGYTVSGLNDGYEYTGRVLDVTPDGQQIKVKDEVSLTTFWTMASTVDVATYWL